MLVIQGLKEHITKRSDVLERDAQWEKSVSHPMKSTLEMAFVCYKIENRKNVDFADFYAPVLPTGVKT